MACFSDSRLYQPIFFENHSELYLLDLGAFENQTNQENKEKKIYEWKNLGEIKGLAESTLTSADGIPISKEQMKLPESAEDFMQRNYSLSINEDLNENVSYRQLIYTARKKIFLIGGRQIYQENDQKLYFKPRHDCCEVFTDPKFVTPPTAVRKRDMISPRFCQSMTGMLDGRYIAVACGSESLEISTDTSEYYDVESDVWYPLPRLNQKKFQGAIVNVKDKYLYYFGGSFGSHDC